MTINQAASPSLVEVVFSIFLSNGLLVRLLKVLDEYDVAILTHCLHPSLQPDNQV